MRKPSQTAVDSLGQTAKPTSGSTSSGFGFDKLGALLPFAGLLSAPSEAQTAVKSMSPEQQEYFNRPSIKWDWSKMQQDAAKSNMSLSQFMAQSWPQITSGTYNMPVVAKAKGGALSQMAYFAEGSGTGRDDTIDAKLSDGEYVFDAETVALIGDGSSKAGAKKLDQMRQEIRKHKGKALAAGKISSDAKSPLSYLRGA
jgi:hypothetical protein